MSSQFGRAVVEPLLQQGLDYTAVCERLGALSVSDKKKVTQTIYLIRHPISLEKQREYQRRKRLRMKQKYGASIKSLVAPIVKEKIFCLVPPQDLGVLASKYKKVSFMEAV